MAGNLYGWGDNYFGQLAINNIYHDKSSPIQTIAFGTDWSIVSLGTNNSAAIKTDGTLWTWGDNDLGSLADDTIINKSSPIQTVSYTTDWTKVSTGDRFVGAIKKDGTLWMWGKNLSGNLGDDTSDSKSSPVQTIAGGTSWTEISCGHHHAAAIKTDGTLWLWGGNYSGELGNNQGYGDVSSPAQTITAGSTWSKVACGYSHTVALKTDGTLWTWGANYSGQLGNDTTTSVSSPIQTITGGTNWTSITAGFDHTAAIKSDGTLWVWGDNLQGQLGDDTANNASSPIQTITFGTTWSSVSAGENFTIARKTDSTFWAWGRNSSGQLGDNTQVSKSSPVQTISYGTNWTSNIDAGKYYSAGVKSDGTLWLWGRNYLSQLGNNEPGDLTRRSSPVQDITYSSNWSSLASNGFSSMGLKSDGTLWLWGGNFNGELGIDLSGGYFSSPVQTIAGGTDWNFIAGGYGHNSAIKTDGTLWLWGGNSYGQLGDNTDTDKSSPVQTVTGGTNWIYVSCGESFTGGIKSDNTLWMWGNNYDGQLGTNQGYGTNTSSPVQTIAGGSDWTQISCGAYHIGAIKTDGTLWLWGYNYHGQLGDDTTISKSSPVQTIVGGTNWSQIQCTRSFSAAIKTDGTLWFWGANYNGQLGDDSIIKRSSPVQTIAGGTNWDTVSISDNGQVGSVTAALKKDGSLWVWGSNSRGSLGDNTTVNKSSPIQTLVGGNSWQTVEAVDGGVLAIGTLSNPATQLDINTQPAYAFNGRPLGVQPIIHATDGSSIDSSFAGNITVAIVSGTPTISGTTTVSAVNGVGTFSGLIINGIGNFGLEFTSSGLTSAYSNLLSLQDETPVIPKRSEVAGSVPTSGQLVVGELALNLVDKKGYVKKTDGTIVNVFTGLQSGTITSGMLGAGAVQAANIASGAITTGAAGSNGQIQYNTSGLFGGASGLIYATSGTQVSITNLNTSNIALGINTLSGNTANMTEWKPFSGNPFAYFNASGNLYAAGIDGGLF